MVGLTWITDLLRRKTSSLWILVITGLLMIIADPFLLFSLSFQLSFAATAGIILFGTPLQTMFTLLLQKQIQKQTVLSFVTPVISQTVVAQLLVTPIILQSFGTTTAWSLLTNILIGPVVSPVVNIALIILVVSFLFPEIAQFIAWSFSLVFEYVLLVVKLFGELKWGQITVTFSWSSIHLMDSGGTSIFTWQILSSSPEFGMNSRSLGVAFSFTFLSILLLSRFLFFWPDANLRYIQCDMGQGDAILITMEFTQILVDTGRNNQVLSCLEKNIPFWDRNLNLVIVPHPDTDHSGGLDDVLQHYPVNKLVVTDYAKETIEKGVNNLLSESTEQVIAVPPVSKIEANQIEVEFLWPLENPAEKSIYSDNDLSVVSHITFGQFSALLTGDITSTVEKKLIQEGSDLKSMVLKVSHHGSHFSTSPEFLYELNPIIATVGVGKNSYGHPFKQVIEILAQNNISVLEQTLINRLLSPVMARHGGWRKISNNPFQFNQLMKNCMIALTCKKKRQVLLIYTVRLNSSR